MTNRRIGYKVVTKPPRSGFYVYGLYDKGKNEVFYIGKGSGHRMLNHVSEWCCGHICNAAKFERIGNIYKSGGNITYLIFKETKNEKVAFAVERLLIKMMGIENLTNLSGGFEPQSERDRVKALDLLQRLKPNSAKRSKFYSSIRTFLTQVVESFGYIVEDLDGFKRVSFEEIKRTYIKTA